MQLWRFGLGFVLASGLGAALAGGCAAGNSTTRTFAGAGASGGAAGAGASGAGSSGVGASGVTSSTTGTLVGGGGMAAGTGGGIMDASTPDGFGSCAQFSAVAQQDPAAMLVLLQASSSMTLASKWPVAQQAVVQAIDQDVFDTMSLGLMAWPSGFVPPPQCLLTGAGCNLCPNPVKCCGLLPNGVACAVPTAPQVAVAPAGMNKSTAATGVRHDIAQWLTSNGPTTEAQDPANSTPLYDAIQSALSALTAVNISKRMLLVITDGGGSCTSVDTPQRPAIDDGNMCPDWELPTNISTMLASAQTDPNTPVETFIVGVPDSSSTPKQNIGFYQAAPYYMSLALSTYAVAGSPSTVPSNCDATAVWTQTGLPPSVPCHIDLSNSTNFNPTVLAQAINSLRSAALGCAYNLPMPPPGQTLNVNDVNVVEVINGTSDVIPRRKNPTDTCLQTPCWDYNAGGQVQLIGLACSDLSANLGSEVDIYVGCATQFN